MLEEDEECGCQCAGISARHCAGHFNEVGNANSAYKQTTALLSHVSQFSHKRGMSTVINNLMV